MFIAFYRKIFGGNFMRKTSALLIIGFIFLALFLVQGGFTYSIQGTSSNMQGSANAGLVNVSALDFLHLTPDMHYSMRPGSMIFLGIGLISLAAWGRKIYRRRLSS